MNIATATISKEKLVNFLKEVMNLERKFDLDMSHQTTARQSKIKELVEDYCKNNLDNENQ